jgi:ribosomal protein S18 acetylase RimI-like enzyme
MNSKHITYISGNGELLDEIQALWEGLNKHHQTVSTYFKDDFATFTFAERKRRLLKKYLHKDLRIDLAICDDHPVGYIISGANADGTGEIESVYIEEGYRGMNIGDELMRRALFWLDEREVHTNVIDVAVGNEPAYKFYARYGFFPRVTRLKQRK